MAETKARSAELSNVLFSKAFDKIAEEKGIEPSVQTEIRSALDDATKSAVIQAAYVDDKIFYRWVLWVLAAAVLITTIGGLALTVYHLEIPQFIIAIGTTALGSIAGLLAPSPIAR